MAEKLWDYLRAFVVPFSDIALGCLLMSLILMLMRGELSVGLPVWILCLSIQLIVSFWMISAGTSWSVYLAVQGTAIIASCYLTLRASSCIPDFCRRDVMMFLGVLAAAAGGHSAFVAYRPPGANSILRYVDVMIGLSAFYLYTAFETGRPGNTVYLYMALAAIALDLVVIGHLRTGGECANVIHGAGTGSRFALAALAVCCLVLTGSVVGLASGQVHSLVDILLVILQGIYRVLSVIFGAVGQVLGILILFLVVLLPTAPKRAQENAAVRLAEITEEISEEGGFVPPEWVCHLLIGAVCLILAIWVLYYFRNIRIQKIAIVRRRHVVRKSYLPESLLRLWKQIKDKALFEYEYQCNKKTPQGLFVLAERIGKKRKLPRRPGESPGAYVRRLNEAVMQCQPVRGQDIPRQGYAELARLADILDEIFYAECPWEGGKIDYPSCVRWLRCLR